MILLDLTFIGSDIDWLEISCECPPFLVNYHFCIKKKNGRFCNNSEMDKAKLSQLEIVK